MKLSDYVIDFIRLEGIDHVFEFIGGAITHLIDSVYHRKDIACVSVHHEQSAAFAAEAYGRLKGLGVAMATSGPGALNMLTGVGSCWFDSVPCLFITGQVNTYEYKFDRPVRQVGFQETDIVSVAKPITKYAVLVTDPATIRYQLEKAVWTARSGRPGPVLIDIPMNVQRADIDPETLASFYGSEEQLQVSSNMFPVDFQVVTNVAKLLLEARRPIILAGGGIRAGGAVSEFRRFVAQTEIPVVTTLMGLDAPDQQRPEFIGLIGSYGHRYSNLALANCDCLLVLGSRLDSRQTGTRPETFARGAVKIHVDIDRYELNSRVKVDHPIKADLREFLILLNSALSKRFADIGSWNSLINKYKSNYPTTGDEPSAGSVNPNEFMAKLGKKLRSDDIVTLDVGQNQMWAAQSLGLRPDQRMLISGGMGAMGFSMPAALGATFAGAGKRAISISGDGGIQVNIQELEVIASRNLPVKVIVLNNRCLGMVRQFQDMYFGGRRQSTVIGYGCPDLVRVAAAYGLPTYEIDRMTDVGPVLERALEEEGPAFIHVTLELDTTVNPKLLVNQPIEDMSPYMKREELANNMLICPLKENDRPK